MTNICTLACFQDFVSLRSLHAELSSGITLEQQNNHFNIYPVLQKVEIGKGPFLRKCNVLQMLVLILV